MMINEKPLLMFGIYSSMSHEDGRFFVFKDRLHMSLTVSAFTSYSGALVPCATIYGELVETGYNWQIRDGKMANYGFNNFQGQEKNHVFFEHEGSLHFIYQGSPQVICRLAQDGVTVEEVFRTDSPSWEHGEIRGGTQPLAGVIRPDRWLRFFHSLHKEGKNRQDWSYAIGALEMSNKPPFQIERISQWPVFSGDERYVPGWRYWKSNVAIVYGAIPDGVGWLLSAGLNDSLCCTLKVTEKELNL